MPATKSAPKTRKTTRTKATPKATRKTTAAASKRVTKTPAKSTAKAKTAAKSAAKPAVKAAAKKAAKPAAKLIPSVTQKTASKTTAKASRSAAAKKAAAKAPAKRKRVFGEIGGENEQLWREYAKTHNPAIRNQLMEMYLPVVHFIAERLLLTLPRSIEVDDLKSAGIFGLMDAIDGFDIDRAIKFKTYCSTRVRGAILDELRSQDWVPRLVRLRAHQLTRTQAALEARHGRLPTDAEMADEMQVTVHVYIAMTEEARAHTVRSLSESWDDGSGDQPVEKIDFLKDPSSPDPADVLNQEDVMKAIIRSLNKREKEIILMYYRDGLTMKQIGGLMGLTESRVCQIHSNVMKKLKLHLEESHEQLVV